MYYYLTTNYGGGYDIYEKEHDSLERLASSLRECLAFFPDMDCMYVQTWEWPEGCYRPNREYFQAEEILSLFPPFRGVMQL